MLLALLAANSLANGPSLTWTAPPQCPSTAEVEARVRAEVPEGAGSGLEVTGVVTVDESQGLFRLALVLHHPDGSTGRRHLEAARCEDLSALAAFVIAVAASSTEASEVHDEAEEPAESEAQVVPTAPATREASAPSPSSSEEDVAPPPRASAEPRGGPATAAHFWASIEGALSVGALPRLTGGLLGTLGVRFRFIELGLGASHWFARRLEGEDAAATVQLTAGSLQVRGLIPARRLTWGPELALELGGLRAEGVEGTALVVEWNLWSALVAGLALAVDLDRAKRWAFVVRADAVVPFQRWVFFIDPQELGRTTPVGFRAALGIHVTLPGRAG